MQDALLGEADIIQTISFDQHEIIGDIIRLHCPWGIDVDPTYNVGGFYRHGIPRPRYCYDINPLRPEVEKADARDLPLPAGSVRSVMLDPPFFATTQKSGVGSIMAKKYSYVETMAELRELYRDLLDEAWRILEPQGVLIFKCQDCLNGRQNHFTHVWIHTKAEQIGFRGLDLFVKLSKSAPRAWNHGEQHHARKMHCYFWVFRKPGRRKAS